MMDHLLIDIPEIRLPHDMAWRVRFVEAVEQHARRLGLAGSFEAPRFFGYYFTGPHPVVMAGHWTVMLDDLPLMRRLRQTIETLTDGRFSISSPQEGEDPEFLLVHDRYDGSCWLWDYGHGRRFLEASDPVALRGRYDEAVGDLGEGDNDPDLPGA